MCTWVRMSQNLLSMWLRAKNNYCRGLTKGFYHCASVQLQKINQGLLAQKMYPAAPVQKIYQAANMVIYMKFANCLVLAISELEL
jgi:hypothetical protein